jgi:DNA-binding NarL/FixJ family response regulator
MGTRLRVVLAPNQLRAIADAIERGMTIEIAAQVLDRQTLEHAGLEASDTILLEVQGDARPGDPGRSTAREDGASAEPLTPREREVLELVAEGMSNRAIAERLAISEHTVKFHVGSLLGKLSAATRAELVAVALRRGLIML